MPNTVARRNHHHSVTRSGRHYGMGARAAAQLVRTAAHRVGHYLRHRSTARESNVREEKPSEGLETGFQPGHSTMDHVKKLTRYGKKKFKNQKKFQKKVVKALVCDSKFQVINNNTLLSPAVAADNQGWFEIPIMCGSAYTQPGVSTDAINANFTQNPDNGEGEEVIDLAINAYSGLLQSSITAGSNAITGGASTSANLAQAFVHGYMIEYNLINFNTMPIRCDVYEVSCIRRMDQAPTSGLLSGMATFTSGNDGIMHLAANYESAVTGTVKTSHTKTTVNELTVQTNPFTFQNFGRYFRVDKHHTHVLDVGQTLTLDKRYKFNRAIKATDITGTSFIPGLSHGILISFRANTAKQATASANNGYYAQQIPGVAFGTGGFTHGFGCTYTKKYVVVPNTASQMHLGAGSIV